VLDSALPLQRTAPFDILPQSARAFAGVFAECADAAACAAAFPHLATVFERMVARLNAHPVRLPTLAMGARGPVPTGRRYPAPANGENLVETAFGLLQGGAASMVPKMIFDLQKGDTTLFAQAYAVTQSSLPFNAGTYLSVVCEDRARARLKTLSGGMLRRVGIAQAIVNDPELLLLDEPTAGLDPEQRVGFRTLLREIGQRGTVIASTHLVEDVGAACAEVALLDRGRIVFRGTPAELTARGAGHAVGDAPLERGYSAVLAGARS